MNVQIDLYFVADLRAWNEEKDYELQSSFFTCQGDIDTVALNIDTGNMILTFEQTQNFD